MTTRRSFLASLAALFVAPDIRKRRREFQRKTEALMEHNSKVEVEQHGFHTITIVGGIVTEIS